VRGGGAVSRARARWTVTPMQAILWRRGPIRYRLYFGAGGLAFGLVLGLLQGIKIGRSAGDHGGASEEPAGAGGRWPASDGSARAGRRSGRAHRLRRVADPAAAQAATPPLEQQPDHDEAQQDPKASPLAATDQ
jgi:hypothetical protein